MNALTHVFSNKRESVAEHDPARLQFEKIAVPHLSRLYAAALYFTKNKAEAEDLVQETYLSAFSFFEHFEPGTNCRAWLLSVMKNLCINRYRKARREPESVDGNEVDSKYESMIAEEEKARTKNPEELFLSKLMGDQISKALQELPEDYRTAIVLVDVQELTYEETAKIMECPIGTVRTRVSRGRRLLQVALRDYALEQGWIKESSQRRFAPLAGLDRVSG